MTSTPEQNGPGAAPQDEGALSARVTRLEEQLAWFEHTLQGLDEVVRSLATDNQRLRGALGELSEQVQSQGLVSAQHQAQADLEYERPPHY